MLNLMPNRKQIMGNPRKTMPIPPPPINNYFYDIPKNKDIGYNIINNYPFQNKNQNIPDIVEDMKQNIIKKTMRTQGKSEPINKGNIKSILIKRFSIKTSKNN